MIELSHSRGLKLATWDGQNDKESGTEFKDSGYRPGTEGSVTLYGYKNIELVLVVGKLIG